MTRLDLTLLTALRERYRAAPAVYHATRYWEAYESSIYQEVARLEVEQIDSGLYPFLATFGFGNGPYRRRSRSKSFKAGRVVVDAVLDTTNRLIGARKLDFLPYHIKLQDLNELALARAELAALRAGAQPPSAVQATAFGDPQDLFEVDGRRFSISYLTYFLRYCLVHQTVRLRGDELFVEIGSGPGKQAAVLKQALPGATLFCFDLPLQLFLAYQYARGFMADAIVPLEQTQDWTDLSGLQSGKIHFFGNWQIPLVNGLRHDVFWNAASFGEMEPHVVKHYLAQVTPGARWIYLMQARHGKESGRRRGGVERPQRFEDYCDYLGGYALRRDQVAQGGLKAYRESGGYFEAVWERSAPVP
jgi:putative sugar O-methyltransferase